MHQSPSPGTATGFLQGGDSSRREHLHGVLAQGVDGLQLAGRLVRLVEGDVVVGDQLTDRVGDPVQDQLQLRRLKKRKLLLKDQIQRLRARLIPDIIA